MSSFNQTFRVTIRDLLFSPFFTIRYLLHKGIKTHSKHLAGDLMDFGCGTKPYKHLFIHVKSYTGVDFKGGGNPYEKTGVDVYYDGSHIPFENNHFDSVLATEVFEHIFNIDEILAEINRVLKPSGTMLLTCPFLWPEHEQPWDYARYSSFGIRHLMERHGFEVIIQQKTGNFILCLNQLTVLYIYYMIPKIPILYHVLYFLLTLPFNLLTVLLHVMLPAKLKRKDLYLNNILVVRKKKII